MKKLPPLFIRFALVLLLTQSLSFPVHAQDDEFSLDDAPTAPTGDLTLPKENPPPTSSTPPPTQAPTPTPAPSPSTVEQHSPPNIDTPPPTFNQESPGSTGENISNSSPGSGSISDEVAEPNPTSTLPPTSNGSIGVIPPSQGSESTTKESVTIPPSVTPKKKSSPRRESTPTYAGTGDSTDPDFQTEERFHQIYRKYNEAPTSVEQWEKIVGERNAQSYTIQSGDTLWDLSKTLFADPNYWPKIWALNKESIYNPHQIDPKLNIHFFPGTKSQPPTLGLSDKPAPEAPSANPLQAQNAGSESTESKESSVIPKARTRVPVVTQLPPSLPRYSVKGVEKPQLIVERKPIIKASPYVPLSYYLGEESLAGSGKVKETEMGMDSAFEFQYIFVTLADPSQKTYTVVKENELIGLSESPDSPRLHIFEVQGEIEVLNAVNEKINLYRAIVKKSLQRVEVGGILIPGTLPNVDVSETAAQSLSLPSEIIGGQHGKVNVVYGANTFVFLNHGSSQGLTEGMTLPVYATYKNRNSLSQATSNQRMVGMVKVVRVTNTTATAYVIKSSDDIRRGDIVGNTQVLSFNEATEETSSPSEEIPEETASAPSDSAPAASDDDLQIE